MILIRAWEFAAKNQFRMDAHRSVGIHACHGAAGWSAAANNSCESPRQEASTSRPTRVDEEALRKCILIGFSDRVARRMDEGHSHGANSCMAGGERWQRKASCAKSPLIVVAEVREIGGKPGDVNTILSLATAIEIEWLQELFPNDMHYGDSRSAWIRVSMRVRADDVLRFRDLAVQSETCGTAAGRRCSAVCSRKKSWRDGCALPSGIMA